MSKSGFLSIDWPETENDSLLEWDVLIATATRPTLRSQEYPSSGTIAQAWRISEDRSAVKYFWKNRDNGIETFQDAEIEAMLRSPEQQR